MIKTCRDVLFRKVHGSHDWTDDMGYRYHCYGYWNRR